MSEDARIVRSAAGEPETGAWSWHELADAVAAKRLAIVQATPMGAPLDTQTQADVCRLAAVGRLVAKRAEPLEDVLRLWQSVPAPRDGTGA